MSASTERNVSDRAIDRWRLQGLQRRLTSVAYPDLVLGYGLLIVVVFIAFLTFMATPTEPFSFDGDLGFTHETVAGAVKSIHSWTDVIDSLGWTPWYNFPLFYYNSNVSEAFLTMVTWFSGNAWLSIKIVQVLQIIVTVGAASAMYSTQSRRKFWALVFGITYAALPITAMAIRGNPTMGWLAALAPAAIAAGTLLLRKYGASAVPLVGFLCAAVGYGLAIEYAAFSSLPLFAVVIAGERRQLRPIDWLTFVPLGLLCCFAMGAFYIVPTFVEPVISDAALRTATLVHGAFLGNFSETFPGLLTLIPRESYVSPFTAYNAGPEMPNLFVFGAILWSAALANLARNRRRSAGWADPASIVIVASCTILALGTTIPFGQDLWNALLNIPHFNAIRTTDRFLIIPALFVAFWYVFTLERIASSFQISGKRAGGWISLAIVIAFVGFDASQHCFAIDPSKGYRQPQIEAVRTVVEAEGGRTASFAGVNGGASFESASEYGVPESTTPAAIDLGWRFMEDGNGSVGVIARTGVRTVITAPNWTGAPDFPNTAAIYQQLPSVPIIFKSTENVLVSRLPARSDVSAQTPLCVYGGPGGFDLLDVDTELSGAAFLESRADCKASGFLNFDPRDLWIANPDVESWPGSTLSPSDERIRDTDYPFLPNRSLLNIPWYRNSIDGDRPLFDPAGAIEVAHFQKFTLPRHADWPAGTTVAIRLSSHADGALAINAAPNNLAVVNVSAKQGFNWYEAVMPNAVRADTPVSFDLQPAEQDASAKWSGYALDGIAIRRTAPAILRLQPRPAFVAISINRFEPSDHRPASTDVPVSAASDPAVVGTNMHFESDQAAPGWQADGPDSELRYRWMGAPGLYVIQAQAVLTKPGDTVGMDATRRATCCLLTATNLAGFTGGLEGRFQLQKGSQIVVRLVSPDFDAENPERITAITIKRVTFALNAPTKTGSSGTIDFNSAYDPPADLAIIHRIRFKLPYAYGEAGSELGAAFTLSGRPRSVSLEVIKNGAGSATASLRCNGASPREVPLSDDDTAVALSGTGFNRCSIGIRWSSGDLGIRVIKVTSGGVLRPAGSAVVWVPRGTYRVSVIEADGKVLGRLPFHSAGCVGSIPICKFNAAGSHRIILGNLPAEARLLMLASVNRTPKSPGIMVKQTAALRWDLALNKTANVALTQLYDGNWIVTNAQHTYSGQRCDITNTCFPTVAPGSYHLYHQWPRPLRSGLEITLGSLVLALLVLFARFPQNRSPASV